MLHASSDLPIPRSPFSGELEPGRSRRETYLILHRVGFAAFHPLKKGEHKVRPYDNDSSLWHFPSDCSAWPLTSTLPYGVRTFLTLNPLAEE